MAREDIEEWADGFFVGELNFHKRKTFSSPSYYKGGKMFAFVYGDGLGLKFTEERAAELIASDPTTYSPFNPGGKHPMKRWVIVTHPDVPSYEDDRALIEESLDGFTRN